MSRRSAGVDSVAALKDDYFQLAGLDEIVPGFGSDA